MVEGGIQLYKNIFLSHEQPNRTYRGSGILSCKPYIQNAAKSISDITTHLAGRFQPVGLLSASTRAI